MASALLAPLTLLALAADPAAVGEPPIAGRFENKIVYGVVSEGVDVARLRQDCAKRGGRFDECGSACAPDAICASVCAFTCELTPATKVPDGDLASGLWVRYVSSALGFELEHPTSMAVKGGHGGQGVLFELHPTAGPAGASDPGGMDLLVEREECAHGASLEEIARKEAARDGSPGDVEAIQVGVLQGYAFEQTVQRRVTTWLLAAPDGRSYWRLHHSWHDPEGRGYERVMERMLASFAASGSGAAPN